MENATANAKLFAKIAAVMGAVRTLEKTGRNQFDKYDYVTADAIATRMGSVMAENGLAFLPSLVSVETSEYTTQKGGSNFRTVVTMQMILACTETGATWASLWQGEAIDRSDKSISKAAVSAVKYYLLKTFLLAGGDEEDADAASPAIEGPKRGTQNASKPAPDDNLWEPETPPTKPKQGITSAQQTRIAVLGADAYKSEWIGNSAKLAEWASSGTVHSIDDLLATEADKLIKALEKKIKGATASTVAPVANGNGKPVPA